MILFKRGTRARGGVVVWAMSVGLAVFAACALAGCKLPETDSGDDGGSKLFDPDKLDPDKVAAAQDEILDVLRMLFPDLSESELAEIKGSLDLDAVLALQAELEAVRDSVVKFSEDLFKSAEEHVADREKDLAAHNDGFPEGLEAVGHACAYDSARGHGQAQLTGVFNGKDSVLLEPGNVTLNVNGKSQAFELSCLQGGGTVDVVFLIDITGSMSNVIDSVRDSVVSFVNVIESSGLRGTLSVVTFQDTVGVNRTFQEPAPPNDYERSPFFEPVSLSDADAVERLRRFVNRLEANRGADAPENLAGAIDFARNSVIGSIGNQPNVIGDGIADPAGTEPFPKLESDHQVFVVLTDVGFHGDDRSERNSSLEAPFVPRDAAEILRTLHETGTTVHVSDPSWADTSLSPGSSSVDADYWAIHTGGVGEDVVAGYSLVDLELVVVAEDTGLLDITLDEILASSCTLDFDATLAADAEVSISLDVGGALSSTVLDVQRY